MSLVFLIVVPPALLAALVVVLVALRPRSAKSIALVLDSLTPVVEALVPWRARDKSPNQHGGKVEE